MKVSVTVKREFMEEALDSTGAAKVTICSSESILRENLSLTIHLNATPKMVAKVTIFKHLKKWETTHINCV